MTCFWSSLPKGVEAMKRILEIGIYKPSDLTAEVISLADVNAHVAGARVEFTGHATVKSRFRGHDFSGLYQLTKVYEAQQGRWQVIASRTARLGGQMKHGVGSYFE